MAIVSNDTDRLDAAIESAEAAFWADIVTSYPEATSGDLSPHCAMKLAAAMGDAVTEWLMFNCDVPEVQNPKSIEILLHNVDYVYRDFDDLELTEGDKEHIAYCISQDISEGELCTHIEAAQEVYGWWKINNG